MKKKVNLVRYINAYGEVATKIVSDKLLERYINNWNWHFNGDDSGLEVIIVEFESIFIDSL